MGYFELVVNHVRKKYNIKKEKLKSYAKRVWDLIQKFDYFNIIIIPREKNQKVDSIEVLASLFILRSSFHDSCHVKMIFHPSIPDNQNFWQVFENEEHIVEFLMSTETTEQKNEKDMSSES